MKRAGQKPVKIWFENGVGKTPAQIAPGTKVYELAEELAKYLPEEIQKYFY